MSKNSDWGVITYLSHSQYGINTMIRLNNNLNYITGCGATIADGASTATCEIAYGSNVASYPQSTTGNISGIFDMSGGAWEYQMGVYTNATNDKYSGLCNIYTSGYKGLYGNPSYTGCDGVTTSNTSGLDYPMSRYYRMYSSTSWASSASNLGDALGETQSCYKDYNGFVVASYPWFIRGGYNGNGVIAGGFYFGSSSGDAHSSVSFRSVVLTS